MRQDAGHFKSSCDERREGFKYLRKGGVDETQVRRMMVIWVQTQAGRDKTEAISIIGQLLA